MRVRLAIRRHLGAILLAGALALFAAPGAHAAVKTDTQAAAGVTASGAVSGTGTVSAKGKGVASAPVEILLDGVVVQTTTTDAKGEFPIDFSMGSAGAGTHTITARFGGNATYTGSSIDLVVEIGGALPGRISGSVDPGTVVAGDILSVSGALADASGAPVASALISFALGGRAVQESTTSTGPDGSFSSIVAIPDDQQPGSLHLVVRYAGNATVGAASEGWDITVERPAPVSTPTPSESPAPEPSPSASPAPSPETAPSPSAQASAAATPLPGGSASGGIPWFAVTTLAIAVGVGTVTAFFAYRSRAGRGGRYLAADTDRGLLDDLGGSLTGHDDPPATR
ncbi:MAG: hypothetical protein Q3997_00110 [Propionibacteriaceae bacterium]|nr:hypothetical protein [Propionibacteriaceae bacterium]